MFTITQGMENLRKFMEKINSEGKSPVSLRYDEPMSRHTTFKLGGKADVWVRPQKDIFIKYTQRLLKAAGECEIPVFIVGSGANIVVSDKGIRGIVLDTGSYRGVGKREELNKDGEPEKNEEKGSSVFSVSVLSGTSVDGLCSRLADRGLSGLEFLAGMPGSVGGAVWMNARCYEKSVSDVLLETEILNENFEREIIPYNAEDFSYKKSPFQNRKVLILSARLLVRFRNSIDIRSNNASFRQDRNDKGHYLFPSAGSAFKNNRDFGESTGRIIDKLGLKGLKMGGAQVAPYHGNIVINAGKASAADVRDLMAEVARRVKEERGLELENEIIFAGEWS